MATPYPGMDPEYLKSLQAMIAAMGPSVADKDAAKYQGLLAMGLGLMGARKGQEFAAAGNAGLLGLDARNRSLAQATAEKGAGLNQALNAQQLQGAMQAQADEALMRKLSQERYSPAASQPAPFGAQGGAPAAAQFGPAIAPATDGARLSTSKLSDYERAIADAQYYEAKGAPPKYVEAAYAKAEKLRPKVKETRAVVDPQTGQRVLANIYEDGRIEIQKGAAPDMEKAHFVNEGGRTTARDPFTAAQIGAAIPMSQSPDSKAANALGWARFNEEKRRAADTQAKPQWDSASGQFVIAPTAANPTGSAVSPAGFNKPEKQLTESQAKAVAYVNQMDNANAALEELKKSGFDGKSKYQQGAIASAGTEGIPYVPGSAAIPRWLASDNAQKYNNAELQWTEPMLRFLTGANAPATEVKRMADTFFPRPGDSDAVIQQKEEARNAAERSLRLAAGSGSSKVPTRKKDVRSEADRILAGGN